MEQVGVLLYIISSFCQEQTIILAARGEIH
uniref:Uncharacterized protein n=1 Tax=Anguilla anguilla TaxID=7936 RepID=A0A0E9SVE1_ANGAN